MEPRDYEMGIEWFDHKIDHYLSNQQRNPFATGHLNVRRLMIQRNMLIEAYEIYKTVSKKNDIGIKMFIKQHRII